MIRTQIYLPKELKDELDALAIQENMSMAEVLRQLLKSIPIKKQVINNRSNINSISQLADLGIKSKQKTNAANVNNYLYETR